MMEISISYTIKEGQQPGFIAAFADDCT